MQPLLDIETSSTFYNDRRIATTNVFYVAPGCYTKQRFLRETFPGQVFSLARQTDITHTTSSSDTFKIDDVMIK